MAIVHDLPKFLVLLLFAITGVYVHLRGRVRHGLARQLTDHSTVMAPYNTLMYLFSAVPARPFIDIDHFPELSQLQANWLSIRDEGLRLFDQGHIKAAGKFNDLG